MTSNGFSFEAPPGWRPAGDGERLTFIDDRGGVLAVSSSRVMGAEPAPALEAAVSEAFAAIRRAAADRGLEQVSELHESRHPNLRCWTGEARTRDGSLVVSQCVLASQRGVLLATLQTPPPEEAHREVFEAFLRSVFSSELRAILQRVRRTPPTCIASAAPRLDPETEPGRPDTEPFGAAFWLGCPCGSREMAVLCHPTKVGSDVLNLAPLAVECATCNRITEIFDPARHGAGAAVGGGSAGMRGSGERQRFRCSACGHAAGEPVASFAFNDPEGLETLPPEVAGREQDTFDWFTLELRCAGCGEMDHVADYECD